MLDDKNYGPHSPLESMSSVEDLKKSAAMSPVVEEEIEDPEVGTYCCQPHPP